MVTDIALKETKKHGALRFPFNIYPCTIPKDFPEVALHWQSSMELVFIKKGSGIVQVGGRALPAQAGEVFVFTPGTLHALFQSPGIVMEYENIIFDLALLGGADDLCDERYLLPLQSGRLALPVHLTPELSYYTEALVCLHDAEEANRTRLFGYELVIKGALLRLLGMKKKKDGKPLSSENADTQRMKTVLQLIADHYTEELSVSSAAEVCGYSTSHFMRWFKRMTGQHFTAFLNCYRLNIACIALRSGNDTILAVAEQAGFRNLSYFNRLFKSHYGITPQMYRKRE